MNVALATTTASAPVSVMTARGAFAVEKGADTGIPSAPNAAATPSTAPSAEGPSADAAKDPAGRDPAAKDAPIVGGYPRVAVRFDAEASRLVLLFRDPADGATLDQIPTENALKQYREAAKGNKDEKPSLRLLVNGGAGTGETGAAGSPAGADGPARGGSAQGDLAHGDLAQGDLARGGSAQSGRSGIASHTTSGFAPMVVQSASVHTSAGSSAHAATGRVNVVI